MKANSCGTMVEQSRARLGWKTSTERKACGADPKKTCGRCKCLTLESRDSRDGGIGVSVRCGSPLSYGDGFATRESAGCNVWQAKEAL